MYANVCYIAGLTRITSYYLSNAKKVKTNAPASATPTSSKPSTPHDEGQGGFLAITNPLSATPVYHIPQYRASASSVPKWAIAFHGFDNESDIGTSAVPYASATSSTTAAINPNSFMSKEMCRELREVNHRRDEKWSDEVHKRAAGCIGKGEPRQSKPCKFVSEVSTLLHDSLTRC